MDYSENLSQEIIGLSMKPYRKKTMIFFKGPCLLKDLLTSILLLNYISLGNKLRGHQWEG